MVFLQMRAVSWGTVARLTVLEGCCGISSSDLMDYRDSHKSKHSCVRFESSSDSFADRRIRRPVLPEGGAPRTSVLSGAGHISKPTAYLRLKYNSRRPAAVLPREGESHVTSASYHYNTSLGVRRQCNDSSLEIISRENTRSSQ